MKRAMPRSADERELAQLLAQHYGDGQLYFTSPRDRQVFRVACARGLVNEAGMLTARGRQLTSGCH